MKNLCALIGAFFLFAGIAVLVIDRAPAAPRFRFAVSSASVPAAPRVREADAHGIARVAVATGAVSRRR